MDQIQETLNFLKSKWASKPNINFPALHCKRQIKMMAQGGARSCDSVTKPTKARKEKTNLWEVTQEGHVISSPPSTPDTGVYSVQTDCCQGVPYEIQSLKKQQFSTFPPVSII